MNRALLIAAGLGDLVKLVDSCKCPFCRRAVLLEDFKDQQSLREFEISGLCQKCQDETFA